METVAAGELELAEDADGVGGLAGELATTAALWARLEEIGFTVMAGIS
jgi:hypothetical protein